MSQIWNLNAICRCCHADGQFRSLQDRYVVDNNIEVYSVMIRDTLGVVISPPQIPASYMICDTCIGHIRDAYRFKQQVIACEIKFDKYCKSEITNATDIKYETGSESLDVHDEEVKLETSSLDDDTQCNDHSMEFDDQKDLNPEKFNAVHDHNYADTNINITKTSSKSSLSVCVQDVMKKNLKTITKSVKISKRLFKCELCNKTFENQASLMRHNKFFEHGDKVCHICSQPCQSIQKHNNHLKSHKGIFPCSYCKRKFNNAYTHYKHEKIHKFRPYTCDICKKTFAHKTVLSKHISWHNGTHKTKMCDICGRNFNDAGNLKAHIEAVHEKLRPFQCELCPKAFFRKRNLLAHQKLHVDCKKFSCDICDKSYNTLTHLQIHQLKHENKWKCRNCSDIFDDRQTYLLHLKNHNRSQEKKNQLQKNSYPYIFEKCQCEICLKILTNKYSLNRHMLIHNENKIFQCDFCRKSFTQNSVLEKHVQRQHVYITKESCPVCDKKFKDVETHMLSHQNRPFVCQICSRAYTMNTSLNRHMKEVHISPGSHKCDLCDKSYNTKFNLQKHKVKKHELLLP